MADIVHLDMGTDPDLDLKRQQIRRLWQIGKGELQKSGLDLCFRYINLGLYPCLTTLNITVTNADKGEEGVKDSKIFRGRHINIAPKITKRPDAVGWQCPHCDHVCANYSNMQASGLSWFRVSAKCQLILFLDLFIVI